jgi:REP element-mobilizing transposase RayT
VTRSRYRFGEDESPHFLTCTIVGWLPVFTRPITVQYILDSWRFLQEHRGITLFGYVILENHLHFIASGPNLSEQVRHFKSFTARCIIDQLKIHRAETLLNLLAHLKADHKTDSEFQLWQEGSHPEMIGHEEMMRQKLTYMHDNPVKRGYVDEPTHWRYSSARNYAGQPGLIPVTTDWGTMT